MLPYIALMLGAVLTAAAMVALAAIPPRGTQRAAGAFPKSGTVPVLVELFTPENCVGCPAADALLRQIEGTGSVPGAEVIVMDEHLDLGSGLREPQSSRVITNRQIDYGRLFRNDNIFEPQMIIGGRTQLLGAETAHAKEEVARAANVARVKVEVVTQSASVATIKIDKLPDDAPPCDVWMGITESKLVNAGASKLEHSGVVRSLVNLGRINASGPATYSMHLHLNSRWKRRDLKYVVFVQDRVSRRVWGATSVTP